MALKKYKPTSPGMRWRSTSKNEEITKKVPEKSLLLPNPKSGGRNNNGRITCRHRGGGAKRKYRIIDFKRNKLGIQGKVAAVEYDPNRSANIALIHYIDGEKRYILHPHGLKVGDVIISDEKADIKVGNAIPLYNIPLGTLVHNIEMRPGKGGQIARSAGSYVQLMAKEGGMALLRMPSGEMRRVPEACRATIGQVGNIDHENISLGKAGMSRHLGRRPKVRGVAMNPVDHPMGGGEGKASGGRHPCSPWGKKSKGARTRKKNKPSNKYILKRRSK